jgi:hypothetical protein
MGRLGVSPVLLSWRGRKSGGERGVDGVVVELSPEKKARRTGGRGVGGGGPRPHAPCVLSRSLSIVREKGERREAGEGVSRPGLGPEGREVD